MNAFSNCIWFTLFLIAVIQQPLSARTLLVPDDYDNIQLAVNDSQEGDSILVAPGDYPYFEVHDKQNLTFIGNGIDSDERSVVHGVPGSHDIVAVLFDHCRGIEFTGFEVVDGYTGIWVHLSQKVKISHNYIHDTDSWWASSISIDGSAELLIERNIAVRSWHYGFYVVWGTENIVIRHNVIASTYWNDGIHFEGASNGDVYNNIIYTCHDYGVYFYRQNENIRVAYNCLFGNGNVCNQDLDETNIFEDPMFVNPQAGDFGLQEDSPCRDRGDPDSPPDPDGSRADIGYGYFESPNRFVWLPDDPLDFGRVEQGEHLARDISLVYLDGEVEEQLILLQTNPPDGWYSVRPGEEVIELSDTINVRVSVDIPEDAEPGEHPATIELRLDENDRPVSSLRVICTVIEGAAWLFGNVTDLQSGASIPDAQVIIEGAAHEPFSTVTNEDGYYLFDRIPPDRYSLAITHPDFLDWMSNAINVAEDDSIEFNAELLYASCVLDHDSLSISVIEGEQIARHVQMLNSGSGRLEFSAEVTPLGGRRELMDLRANIPTIDETQDRTLQAVEYINGDFFLAGGNNGTGRNLFYRLNREGEIIDAFPQDINYNYGIKDLAWDGENLWGVAGRFIQAYDLDGNITQRFDPQQWYATGVAYDSGRELLWISNSNGELNGLDLDGNLVFSRRDFSPPATGLTWNHLDADGMPLYAVVDSPQDPPCLFKYNPTNGDVAFVGIFEDDEYTGGGCSISHNFEPGNTTLLTLQRQGQDAVTGIGFIKAYQISSNFDWLQVTPDIGVLDPGRTTDLNLTIEGISLPEGLVLPAEIHIDHNGRGHEVILPIELTVEPNSVDPEIIEAQPSEYRFYPPSPNPFNSSATLRFDLPANGEVSLILFDLQGHLVKTLASGNYLLGRHQVVWSAGDLSAGVYICRLEAGKFSAAQRLLLVK